MRQMTLVGFLQAQNCTNFVGSWRHPEAAPDFMSAEYYRRVGRALEAGKFHLGFFDDRLAMPDRYGGDHAHTVANGIRCVKMDPVTILTVMGMATERLGLGSTYTTSYYEPFHVARVFQTLDLMTNGRAAWNVVTSMNDGEALNMGQPSHDDHDRRYMTALDEFMEVVLGHWDLWDDDAIVADKQTGLFAHPGQGAAARLRRGFLRGSRGPFTVPRSPQGHPVIIQAGQSGRGRRFAARWAELVFVNYHNIKTAKEDATPASSAQIAEAGRDLDKVQRRRRHLLRGRRDARRSRGQGRADRQAPEGDRPAFVALREVLNVDLAKKLIDEPWSEEEILTWTGAQGLRDRVARG